MFIKRRKKKRKKKMMQTIVCAHVPTRATWLPRCRGKVFFLLDENIPRKVEIEKTLTARVWIGWGREMVPNIIVS